MDDLRGGVLTLEHRYELMEHARWEGVASRYQGTLQPSGVPIDVWMLDGVERMGFPPRVAQAVASRLRSLSRQACRLRGPNVLRVIDYGEIDEHTPFQISDAIEGPRLSEIIQHQGRLPLSGTIKVVRELAETLEEAHALGFGHLAVRPEHVFFEDTSGGTHARLSCWGHTLLRHELMLVDGSSLEGLASLFNHLAPETFAEESSHRWLRSVSAEGTGFDGEWGEGVLTQGALEPSPNPTDPAAFDVFGLAILTYRCLTGLHPFAGDAMDSMSLAEHLRALERGAPFAPADLGVEVPEEIWKTLRSGLARDPGARPASALDFALKLEAAAGPKVNASAPIEPEEVSMAPASERPEAAAEEDEEPAPASPPKPNLEPAVEEAEGEPPLVHRAVRYMVAAVVVLLSTNLLMLFLLGMEGPGADVTMTPVPADATWTRVDGEQGVEHTGTGGRHIGELPAGRYRVESPGNHPVEVIVERSGGRSVVKVRLPSLSE